MAERDTLFETIEVYNELGAEYADKIAHVRLSQLQEFIDMLPYGALVLDAGCAAGRDSAILRGAGLDVVGIDLSKSLLQLAYERVLGVEFHLMDARRLYFKNNTFHGIWAHAMLLNMRRIEILGVLQEFYRVIKPGGICVVGVKKGEGEKLIAETLVGNMKRRETYFEKPEMEDLFKYAGFEILKSHISGDELGRSVTEWLYVFATKMKK